MSDEFIKLTNENFVLYAAKSYRNDHCLDLEEFHDDLNRIKYIKRLLKRYHKTGILKERLILNHLIIFYNIFYPENATKMLFFKIDSEYYSSLKTFLIFLNLMPENFKIDLSSKTIYNSDINIDYKIANTLRYI